MAYPVPEIVVSNDTTICAGNCIKLSAGGGSEYLWSNGATTSSVIVCPEDTTVFYVTVFNQFGCESEDSVTVNILPSPSTYAGNDTSLCQGQCAVLKAQGGETYLWNTGETTHSIEVCPPDSTTYFVTGYFENGCF